MTKKITIEEALGPQHAGSFPLEKLKGLSEEKLRELYQYRKDVLEKIDPRLGLSFCPDSELPWLRPDRVKLNLGSYKAFSVEGWFNVSDPSSPHERADFIMPLHLLKLEGETVDFLYAPFVLNKMMFPVQAIRNWLHCLKPTACLCIVIEDQYEMLRQGIPGFELLGGLCKTEKLLEEMMKEAGCKGLIKVNFDRFDLCGNESWYRGFFGWKTEVE